MLSFAMLVIGSPLPEIPADTLQQGEVSNPSLTVRLDGHKTEGFGANAAKNIARLDERAWKPDPPVDLVRKSLEKRESVWNKFKDWFRKNFAAPTMQNGYGGPH